MRGWRVGYGCVVLWGLLCGSAAAEQFTIQIGPNLGGGRREVSAQFRTPSAGADPTSIAEFSHTKFWTWDSDSPRPRLIELEREHSRLRTTVITRAAAMKVGGECVLGVVTRETPILLRYFPQAVAGDPAKVSYLQPAAELALQIVPVFTDSAVRFQVLADGKPLADAEVLILDAAHHEHGTSEEVVLHTGPDGLTTFTPAGGAAQDYWPLPGDGDYTIYVRRERPQTGTYQGTEYTAVQDLATLSLRWPLVDTGTAALLHKVQLATQQNLLGPLVLFFFLGFVARLVKSDLRFPVEAYQVIVIYLLLKIGYEGGHDLRQVPSLLDALVPMGAGFVVNGLVAILGVFLLRSVFRFDTANSCALGALYGSDSAGLFAVALVLVKGFQLPTDGFMNALLAVMEIPGVLAGIILYRMLSTSKHAAPLDPLDSRIEPQHDRHGLLGVLLHELKSPGVYMLLGGIVVGYLTVPSGYLKTEPFFVEPFTGVMCLFLFENGLKAGEQVSSLRKGGLALTVFGVGFPILTGIAGVFIAHWLGLQMGSAVLFAILVAAPSNIAAPAAMRLAIPEANPSIYFTTALGISFPALVVLGVPIFYVVTQFVY